MSSPLDPCFLWLRLPWCFWSHNAWGRWPICCASAHAREWRTWLSDFRLPTFMLQIITPWSKDFRTCQLYHQYSGFQVKFYSPNAKELMLLNCGVGEDSWESLGLQGDPSVHPKGNQSWIFIGRTDAGAEAPILWPPDGKYWLIGKDPDAGKHWRQKEKRAAEDKIVR